jgi:AcrR family transcriptional regulator
MSDAPAKGRPILADATPKALKAAQDILLSQGFAKLTIEKVAARTGLGKPTLYRRWANASELAMAALLDLAVPIPAPEGPGLEAAFLTQMRALVAAFGGDWGRQVVLTLAAADPEAAATQAFAQALLLEPRAQGKAAFEAAIAAGEILAPPDLEALLDMLYAPVLSRALLGHRQLYPGLAAALVKTALLVCGKVTKPARSTKPEDRQASLF